MKAIEWFADEGARSISARDWDAYGKLFSTDLAMRAPGLAGVTTGREARLRYVQGIITAFPDGQVEVENSFGHGDWGCIQVQFAGTHTGPLTSPDGAEIPATGKSVRFPYCIIAKFENGEAVQLDEYFDQMDLLTQLGVMS